MGCEMEEVRHPYIQIVGMYPEDMDVIRARVGLILGDYFAGEIHRGYNPDSLKFFFLRTTPSTVAHRMFERIDSMIHEGFGPAGKIEVSMEIP